MYRLGSNKGVTGVFLRFFEMFFPGLYRVKGSRGFRLHFFMRFLYDFFYDVLIKTSKNNIFNL